MQQVIYADVLVFLNTVITFILLLTVRQFTGAGTSAGRMIAASFVGGAYSLIILAPKMHFLLMLLAKTAMGVSITYIAFRVRSFRRMLKCLSLFLIASFLYAGIMYSLRYFIGSGFITVQNGSVYFDLSVYSLILITVLIYVVILILRKKVFGVRQEDMVYDLVLTLGENSVTVKALLDSGHTVRDIYTNQPVVILRSEEAGRLTETDCRTPDFWLCAAETGGIAWRLLPVRSLSGEKLLPTFSAETAQTAGENVLKKLGPVSVAVTEDRLGSEAYQALISEDFI